MDLEGYIESKRKVTRDGIDIDIYAAAAYFGIETRVFGESVDVLRRERQTHLTHEGFLCPFLRERVTERDALQSQIGSVLQVPVADAVVLVGCAAQSREAEEVVVLEELLDVLQEVVLVPDLVKRPLDDVAL